MEIAIPLVALGSLYVMSNQNNREEPAPHVENFENVNRHRDALPNTTTQDLNYPNPSSSIESGTFEVNKYNHPNAYTDRYFASPDINTLNAQNLNKNTSSIHQLPQTSAKDVHYSLTGKQINVNNFQHSNMQPFFGGKIRGQTTNSNLQENILDNYVGNGSQYLQKQEMAPLFRPDENVQWAHGMPSISDFEQSRMTSVLGNKMANVKPWEEIREAPGTLGFNSGQEHRDQWIDKTVDQLRVKTNPKVSHSYYGHEGPQKAIHTNVGIQAPVEKNLPDRHFDLGSDRWFTTVGAGTAPTVQGIQPYRNVNRSSTSVSYDGVAGGVNEATYVVGEYMESNRVPSATTNLPAATAVGKGQGDYGQQSHTVYDNNRASNKQPDMMGTVGGVIGAVVAPLMDIFRPSRKENVIGNLRQFDNVKGPNSTYVVNPADRAPTTMRETTEGSTYHWNTQPVHAFGGYSVANEHVNSTQRETTGVEYAGVAGAGFQAKQTSYISEYNQKQNPYKEATTYNRMGHGNGQLMNSSMNVQVGKLEQDRNNNRMWVPARAIQDTPNVQQLGASSVPSYEESMIQSDRNHPDILSAFKNNPYTQSQLINVRAGH